ncbi:hypothetical protein HpHNI57_11800 [Helicobacter pylori]
MSGGKTKHNYKQSCKKFTNHAKNPNNEWKENDTKHNQNYNTKPTFNKLINHATTP